MSELINEFLLFINKTSTNQCLYSESYPDLFIVTAQFKTITTLLSQTTLVRLLFRHL